MKNYSEKIRETIISEMEKNESIFLFGEDIGEYGGCFGITKDLLEKFGKKRIIDSPMSEQAIIGLGIGAAIKGLRPILEIMFMDFMTLAYDQLFNHASIFNYLTQDKVTVPLVIRVPAGGGRGYGATHSKTITAPLMHIPGIKIVSPSNPDDANYLLKDALKQKKPVIFIEHKLLYSYNSKINYDYIEMNKARILKTGSDVSVISYSKTIHDCMDAANELEKQNISCEVIDLRSLKPIDIDTIKASIEKTSNVVIVDEGYSTCGVSSEIISLINENCFYSLDTPPKRINSLDVPISCCSSYETITIPSKQKIIDEVNKLMKQDG